MTKSGSENDVYKLAFRKEFSLSSRGYLTKEQCGLGAPQDDKELPKELNLKIREQECVLFFNDFSKKNAD